MVVLFTRGLYYQPTEKHTGNVKNFVRQSVKREVLLGLMFLKIKIIS